MGLSLIFFRLIFFGSDTNMLNHTLSGTFSLFYPQKKVEIAFPFFYSDPVNDLGWDEYDDKNSIRQITLDCHYRKFLGKFIEQILYLWFCEIRQSEGV